MIRLFLTALLTLAVLPVLAADSTPTVMFNTPTARESGVALDPSEIKHYELYAAHSDGTLTTFIILGSNSTVTLPKAGVYSLTVATVDTEDRKSKPSNTVTYEVDQSAPGCPTDLKIITKQPSPGV